MTKMKLQEHSNCLPNEEAQALIDMLKSYDKELIWSIKPTNVLWRVISFQPLDREFEIAGTKIPQVTVQLEFRLNKRIKGTGKCLLTLFKTKQQTKFRAYQLETEEEHKVTSHNGKTPIMGCHEHIGKEVFKLNPIYSIEDIASWFDYFCDKINLEFTGTPIEPPRT